MKFKKYLCESVNTYAFWITPKGQIVGGLESHISMVISAPEKFGLTREYIDSVYEKYGEQIGVEGKAREQIMKELFKEGFIRIRKYRNSGWVVNIQRLTKRLKERITRWAEKITDIGIDGVKETSPHETVRITDMGSYNKKMPIRKLAAGGILFEEIDKKIDIYECENVFELDNFDKSDAEIF